MSPVERTLKELRKQGMYAEVTEKWNAYARKRHDLFGIVDVLALDINRGFIGVQCTGLDFSSHWKAFTTDKLKVRACINWLKTPGGYLEIWSWRKLKVRRGGKALVWMPRITNLRLEDFLEGWDSL